MMVRAESWFPMRRRRLGTEILLVLGLSLGASAVYSVVSLVAKATSGTALADQTATINGSLSDRPWLDLTYQLLAIGFDLVPVALVLYLLAISGGNPFRRIGFDLTRPGQDLGRGALLVLVVGVPGIVLYVVWRLLGFSAAVVAAPLDGQWYTVPVLVLAALRAALQEEVIVVGYLFTRLRQLGWRKWQIIAGAAVLRGSYHLYQGPGPFVGNVAMGLIFGWCYWRWGRVMPLVVAHWIIDIISFVGYPLAVGLAPALFG
ncbi:CPBP family intramembrane glutamic endopeptidase [Herbiconiux sp. VKM Ac-2851]|uniref:CPBP family intramembrane glutamic endopeptidase n=1 Tax=Herbiconiux sp. VKM Ac-2851 TaxID=2739025 RepID=UPI001564B8AA|nr:CPBP family intramembrane glutamic endopeptidase [Herbiconiux sp. VKM Ac-2851]NQX34227.1 CPBP family intramembrane metalloprotease [Herbiconiux sp. VKM Ac-2851]